ncbi:MAG: hypothetical protein KKC96_03250 [Nanoarchaeota archaeon]|nr:hypothetical protein [Nanoarchaeota archaeon]MBU2459296.1 hypothetical protein [Nanoarchaeota archaeon]
MEEIRIKLDIPKELTGKFEVALEKVLEQFVRRIRFSAVEEIMSKSELTEAQINTLSSDAKKRAVNKYR